MILDSHANIICGPETGFFLRPFAEQQSRVKHVIKRFKQRLDIDQSETSEILRSSESAIEFFDQIMSLVCNRTGLDKDVWAEKSPRNCLHYSRLSCEMPETIFISIIRDGRDVITSRFPNRDDYYCSVERYIESVRAILSFNSERHLIVRYEDMVTDPEVLIRKVLEFCGMQYSRDILMEYQTSSVTRNSKQAKVSEPISKQWLGRWKDPEHSERIARFMSDSDALHWMKVSGYDPIKVEME